MPSISILTLLVFLSIFSLSLALPQGCPAPSNASTVQAGKAIYFITNEDRNDLIALPVGSDGTLSKGSCTSTGGSGSLSIDGSTNQPAVRDGLVSQGSVAIAGKVSTHIARFPFLVLKSGS